MATTYTVIAPLVIAKNEAGADVYVYKGGQVPEGQSDAWIQAHTDSGMIATGKAADKELAAQPPADQTPSK